MTRWLYIVLIGWLATASGAQACVNNSGGINKESYSSNRIAGPHEDALHHTTPDERFQWNIDQLRRMPRKERPAFYEQELESLNLMQTGDYLAAISVLEAIEATGANSYVVAANLGTMYELTGQNEKALQWIREGMARNPDSHDGTEWLHVRILEYKIALASDPDYLRKHPIMPIPDQFRYDDTYAEVMDVQGEKRYVENVQHALDYQLRERLVFIKDNDPIVGDLLAAYGKIMAHGYYPDLGVIYYDMAMGFGPTFAEEITAQRNALQADIDKRQFDRKVIRALGWSVALIGIPAFLIFGWRRKWFFLSSVDYDRHRELQRRERLAKKSAAAQGD